MGCCCAKEGGSCCLFMCCCPGTGKDKSDSYTRDQRLPESVPTHDLTAHKRPKVHVDTAMTTTTASFMSYAQRHEHPTELEKELAKDTEPDNLQYLRLDDTTNMPKTEPEVVRYSIADLPEQATKL